MLEHIEATGYYTHTTRQLPPNFNWIGVLKDLIAGAPLTDPDRIKIQNLAANWPTCACGQLCQVLPRNPDGKPKDHILEVLGRNFLGDIFNRDWKKAL